MKKLYLSIIVLITFLSSCGDFLEEQSQDLAYATSCKDLSELLIGSGYMKHEQQNNLNINGETPYYPWLFVMDDDVTAYTFGEVESGSPLDLIGSFYYWEVNPFTNGGRPYDDYEWKRLYKHIASLNVIINKVTEFTGDPIEEQNRVMGEARFLRAGYYFLLANFYAAPYEKENAHNTLGVPLKTTEYVEDKFYHRATLDSIYSQIIHDLKNAANVLKGIEQPSVYRVNEAAVYSFLSRVYLYMGEWQLALEACEKTEEFEYQVLDLNQHSPTTDFTSSTSPETIFSQGTHALEFIFEEGQWFNDYRVYAYQTSSELLNLYTTDKDLRLSTFFKRTNNTILPRKVQKSGATSVSDGFLIRFPEVLLNKAEALAMLGKEELAIETLNQLRRNRFKDHIVPEIPYSGEELVNFIRDERRRELCFEGHRWFDLRRYAVSSKYPLKKDIIHYKYANGSENKTGQLEGFYTLKAYPEGKNWILPIPGFEIELNPDTMINNIREECTYSE